VDDLRCDADLAEGFFRFDDVWVEEDDLVDDDRDRPLFWATTVNGRRSMAAASATPLRLSISNLLSTQRLSGSSTMRQGKARPCCYYRFFRKTERAFISSFTYIVLRWPQGCSEGGDTCRHHSSSMSDAPRVGETTDAKTIDGNCSRSGNSRILHAERE
jgi:hypothetical protein